MGTHTTRTLLALALGLTTAPLASAAVVLETQQRTITAAITANATTQTRTAPNFAPFVDEVALTTEFAGAQGGTSVNTAVSRIDCQIDPNSIRAIGSFNVEGGIAVNGVTELGEAEVDVQVTFSVTEPTPFNLAAAPRPGLLADDEFELELEDVTRDLDLINIDETMPPQQVSLTGTLQPGTYFIKYKAEATANGPATRRTFSFNLSLGCRADFDGSGSVTSGDIFEFVNAWMAGDIRADIDNQNGIAIDDVFAYLNTWFSGC